ncbi:MAG: L-threonylcarbamoyladenylate synthase [Erysipelotrichaceae bacterium]|nr:L-threonylcarbamoyladenylate synthase [Erysipelotrichaceae bacterium]MDD3809042.1 L-threonylcarbamoyladenylate synthase [Erysipelotrichaceae bacterium]
MGTVLVEKKDIMKVKQYLLNGLVVSFPTETVFGLAAKYDDTAAVDRLFEIKGRDKSKAITLMVESVASAMEFCDLSEDEKRIMERLMPGMITIVVNKKEDAYIPYLERTVGIRIPDDRFVLELLKLTGPLLVTSANKSGQENMVSSDEVLAEFQNEIPLVVKGECQGKIPSTVFKLEGKEVIVFREGTVSKQEILEAIE